MNAPESLFILANIIQRPQQFVVKCRVTEFNSRISSNFVRVIGTGERCLPGDADNCGDGGKAADARRSYPKGEYIRVLINLLCYRQNRGYILYHTFFIVMTTKMPHNAFHVLVSRWILSLTIIKLLKCQIDTHLSSELTNWFVIKMFVYKAYQIIHSI